MAFDNEPHLVRRAARWSERVALDDAAGTWSYASVLDGSAELAARLVERGGEVRQERVAYLVEPGGDHVATLWGIWRAGGVAVPLATSHPPAELDRVLHDSGASMMVVAPALRDRVAGLTGARGIALLASPGSPSPDLPDPRRTRGGAYEAGIRPLREDPTGSDGADPALILYTSGSTGHPKGVVHTHGSLRAQVESLVSAWKWSEADRTLLVLPLHHVHGLVNVVTCALWSGARCDVLPRFEAGAVWDRIIGGGLTIFMAVPTLYARLLAAWNEAPPGRRKAMTEGARRLRLMVSGSAALPVPLLEGWEQATGHRLLERYGMTEIGMALSNPLDGERRSGFVGLPLPGVEVRLAGDDGTPVPAGAAGEIEVRGPGVFREYWNRPDDTRQAFREGWFRTGDVAVVEDGSWRILGRRSVDIIKTGGYKVSALEIEEALRLHPGVEDCAVVGVPDPEWGERVAAAVVERPGATLDRDSLRSWARERLAPYRVPSLVRIVDTLPRNSMGKVTKPAVRELFAPDEPFSGAVEAPPAPGRER